MWDELRNDPFLRTIAVIVVGILLFGLLFNTMPGGTGTMNSGEHMSRAYGYGYSFSSIIGWLLLMLIRILFVVLIGAVLIGAFIWIRNVFFRDNNSALAKAINNDPILKTVVLTTLSIIGLFILFGLLGNFSSVGYAGGMAEVHMGGGYNYYNPSYGISWLLMMLIRVLSYVLIISLVIAIAIYLKSQYDRGNISWFSSPKTADKVQNESKIILDDTDSTV